MVPRTFLGPMAVASVTSPIRLLVGAIAPEAPKAIMQIVARAAIGGLVCMSVLKLAVAMWRSQGIVAMRTMLLGIGCCFHFAFYASRPLPNTFATILVTYATAIHVDQARPSEGRAWYGRWTIELACLVAAAGLFRCDMIMLAVPMLLVLLLRGRVSLLPLLTWGIGLSVVFVGTSVAVDSIMWGRWVWPEGEVFFFNAILDKSSQWGVSPWHWYATHALPKSTLFWFPLAALAPLAATAGSFLACRQNASRTSRNAPPVRQNVEGGHANAGLIGRWFGRSSERSLVAVAAWLGVDVSAGILDVWFPLVFFVVLYSRLPHKEVRFLLPALPMLFAAAGMGVSAFLGGTRGSGLAVGGFVLGRSGRPGNVTCADADASDDSEAAGEGKSLPQSATDQLGTQSSHTDVQLG